MHLVLIHVVRTRFNDAADGADEAIIRRYDCSLREANVLYLGHMRALMSLPFVLALERALRVAKSA